jgi:hypothetical protein
MNDTAAKSSHPSQSSVGQVTALSLRAAGLGEAAIATARRSWVAPTISRPRLHGHPDRYYCSGLAIEIYRPYIRENDLVPRPVEPGRLHYWGRILYDSGAL